MISRYINVFFLFPTPFIATHFHSSLGYKNRVGATFDCADRAGNLKKLMSVIQNVS